jgi:hypothetical protein
LLFQLAVPKNASVDAVMLQDIFSKTSKSPRVCNQVVFSEGVLIALWILDPFWKLGPAMILGSRVACWSFQSLELVSCVVFSVGHDRHPDLTRSSLFIQLLRTSLDRRMPRTAVSRMRNQTNDDHRVFFFSWAGQELGRALASGRPWIRRNGHQPASASRHARLQRHRVRD